MKLLILICLWTAWCSLHSALISVGVTDFLKQKLNRRFRYFRLFYNGVALVSIVPVLIYSRSVQGKLFFSWEGGVGIIYILLWGLVIFLGLQGARAYDLGEFSGLNRLGAGPKAPACFSTRGILGITRHPWYLAGLIFLWVRARYIHLPMVAENLVLTAYFIIGMVLEEQKLIRVYGAPYLAYRQRVSALIPLKWTVRLLGRLIRPG